MCKIKQAPENGYACNRPKTAQMSNEQQCYYQRLTSDMTLITTKINTYNLFRVFQQ